MAPAEVVIDEFPVVVVALTPVKVKVTIDPILVVVAETEAEIAPELKLITVVSDE